MVMWKKYKCKIMYWRQGRSLNLKKHHFQTFQKYQLVMSTHYFKTTKEKYLHVVLIKTDVN